MLLQGLLLSICVYQCLLSWCILYINHCVYSISGCDKEFQLLGGFPPKPLKDPNATVEQTGLTNARITQKAL